ncbi:MAG: Zn-ribbon domain-containing protein [Nanoarchaeota archaeon]|nr:Zn-ribbon domain-containing protein [Nanoarchaeota archaeon]
MPHQCVHCSKLYEDGSEELLKGCSCGAKFFFYIKKEKYEKLKKDSSVPITELSISDKKQVEKDVREMAGLKEEEPVILDLESIRVIKPGKFEIDIVNLFNKRRPLIYKLEEGKYILDLSSTFKGVSQKKLDRKIRNPEKK